MKPPKELPYPEYDDFRCGLKVCWRLYKDKAAAEDCAKAAKHNAKIASSYGYDFGYCAPGTIDWCDRKEMWEVCCP